MYGGQSSEGFLVDYLSAFCLGLIDVLSADQHAEIFAYILLCEEQKYFPDVSVRHKACMQTCINYMLIVTA